MPGIDHTGPADECIRNLGEKFRFFGIDVATGKTEGNGSTGPGAQNQSGATFAFTDIDRRHPHRLSRRKIPIRPAQPSRRGSAPLPHRWA